MTAESKIKILVVDDEKLIRDLLQKVLSLQGLDVRTVPDGHQAAALAKQERFDLAFVDMRMPLMNGPETVRALKEANPQTKYIMMTGYAVEGLLSEADKEGVLLSLQKPFNIGEIVAFIKDFQARRG
jgi:DNA-binding NtrC family response regulator